MEKVAFTLVVTTDSMICINLLALRLNVNHERRNWFHVTRSEIKSPSPATTSGVLEKLCLFCCQKSKKKNNKRYTLVNCVTGEFEKKYQEICSVEGRSPIIG